MKKTREMRLDVPLEQHARLAIEKINRSAKGENITLPSLVLELIDYGLTTIQDNPPPGPPAKPAPDKPKLDLHESLLEILKGIDPEYHSFLRFKLDIKETAVAMEQASLAKLEIAEALHVDYKTVFSALARAKKDQ